MQFDHVGNEIYIYIRDSKWQACEHFDWFN